MVSNEPTRYTCCTENEVKSIKPKISKSTERCKSQFKKPKNLIEREEIKNFRPTQRVFLPLKPSQKSGSPELVNNNS